MKIRNLENFYLSQWASKIVFEDFSDEFGGDTNGFDIFDIV